MMTNRGTENRASEVSKALPGVTAPVAWITTTK